MKLDHFLKPKLFASFILLLLFINVFLFYLYSFVNIKFVDVNPSIENIEKDYNFNFESKDPILTNYHYVATYDFDLYKQGIIRIIADDCLDSVYINSQKVEFDPTLELCDYDKGIVVDITKYSIEGENKLSINFHNTGGVDGRVGIHFEPVLSYNYRIIEIILGLIILTIIFINLKDKFLLKFIVISAVAIRIFYYFQTFWYERSHDADGHIEHVLLILNKGLNISPIDCWECHQQSFYYLINSFFLITIKWVVDIPNFIMYQLLSFTNLVFSIVFVLICYKIYKKLTLNYHLKILGLVFIIFNSITIMQSIKVGNDGLFYLFCAISFYCYLFPKSTPNYNFIFSSVYTVFAKLNGIGILLLSTITNIISILKIKESTLKYISLGIILIVPVIFIFSNILNNYILTLHYIIPNIPADSMKVSNNFHDLLFVDIVDFVERNGSYPFDLENVHNGGRYLLHTLLKTFVIGQFDLHTKNIFYLSILKVLNGNTLLMFLSFLSISIFILIKNHKNKIILKSLLFSICIFIPFLIFRISLPFSSNQDFRYIAPIIIPLTIIYFSFETKVKYLNILVYSFPTLYTILGVYLLLARLFLQM